MCQTNQARRLASAALLLASAALLLATPAAAFRMQIGFNDTCNTGPDLISFNGTEAASCYEPKQISVQCKCENLDSNNKTTSGSPWVVSQHDADGVNDSCSSNVTVTYEGNSSTSCVLMNGETRWLSVDCGVDARQCDGPASDPTDPVVSGSCFPGAAMARRADGTAVPVARLRTGDKVLGVDDSGRVEATTVFRVTHDEPDAVEPTYVRIETAEGPALELSAGHYLPVGTLNLDEMKVARDVVPGDVVFAVSSTSAEAAHALAVARVAKVTRRGRHNVHVLSGRLLVEGVVASHFTESTSWRYKSLAPYWYRIVHAAPSALSL